MHLMAYTPQARRPHPVHATAGHVVTPSESSHALDSRWTWDGRSATQGIRARACAAAGNR